MEAVLGRQDLEDEIARLEDRDEILHIDLSGRDPDDGATRVPYEKGCLFLRFLEELYGRGPFDEFLRALLRPFRFPEHHDRGLRRVSEGEPPLEGRRPGREGSGSRRGPKTPVCRPRRPAPFRRALEEAGRRADAWSAGTLRAADVPFAAWTTQERLRFSAGFRRRFRSTGCGSSTRPSG